MTNTELMDKITSLSEWERIAAEAQAEVDAIKDSLKAELTARGVEELEVGHHILRYTTVLTSRFDTTGFKRIYSDLYAAFTKQTTSKRFSVA